jgi:rSAM/selenodomain-associated transferase 1
MTRVLQVFARAPVPGQSKTRLAPRLGDAGAAELHARLVIRLLDTVFDALPRLGHPRVELWCAPDSTHPFFDRCARRHPLHLREQQGDDLGHRMHGALDDALGRRDWPVLVGTDCLSITADALAAAFDAIDPLPGPDAATRSASDIVLLPTEDGGYALIGAARNHRSLFDDMPWSTDAVQAQTRLRIDRLGWRLHALPTGWDVDRPEDLERLRAVAPELLDALEPR